MQPVPHLCAGLDSVFECVVEAASLDLLSLWPDKGLFDLTTAAGADSLFSRLQLLLLQPGATWGAVSDIL